MISGTHIFHVSPWVRSAAFPSPIMNKANPFSIRSLASTAHAASWLLLCLITTATVFPLAVRAEEAAVSYDAEVKPIFRDHCLGCHNAQARKGDLALDSYAGTMQGGASGEVVYGGDPESSRLWQLVNHDEEPAMPPDGDRMDEAKLALIRRWIEEGAVEQAGTARQKPKSNGLQLEAVPIDATQPSPLPENIYRQPVSDTERASAIVALAASPGAPLIAIGGQRQVLLYHADTAEFLGVLPYPEGSPQSLRFSRDGRLLLVAGGRGRTPAASARTTCVPVSG